MIEVFADAEVIPETVKEIVEALFPGLLLFEWDPYGTNGGKIDPIGFNENDATHVLYDIYKQERAEFQWRISLYRVGEIIGQEIYRSKREQLVARALSVKNQIRTMVAYQLPEKPKYPYSMLVYINGNCYLADDALFDYTGEENSEEIIKILRPHSLPVNIFDSFGCVEQL
ncbi:MAG: hypothetical protein EOO61_08605 [Hymenobacter sp.]|nr:MAG: hypothetical protein EOO61_08605 [Hymenobacter sp.]